MKNLSQLLAEVEPDADRVALREDVIKLKAIAVELAKAMEPALEYMKSSKPPICGCDLSVNFYCPECCVEISFEDAITTARKILEDE